MAAKKGKRTADTYLTDQNWDNEDKKSDEEEEVGTFKEASEDVLAKRVFKKAKRRVGSENTSDTSTKSNPFGGFGGFSTFSAKPPASTVASITKATVTISNQKSSFWSNTNENKDFFASRDEPTTKINSSNAKKDNLTKADNSASKMTSTNATEDNDVYFEQLASLNHSVLSWIKQHVDKNPCIDLTPVFNDYQKHLKELESKYSPKTKKNIVALDANANVFKTPDSMNASPITSVAASTKMMTMFTSSTPIQKDSAIPAATKFGTNNLLFATSPLVTKTEEKQNTENIENEEDANPAPERKTIVEDDAFYQIRCKLFFKKGANWQELGIGMLYLKPCGEKTQLLIRMETTTGKVLLNINLAEDMPISRSGKNNVMLVSVPNPPVFTKPADGDNSIPCTYLIRVKGTTEADELLSKMKPT